MLQILALDDAIRRVLDERMGQVEPLRFYAGLTVVETATVRPEGEHGR